MKIIFVSVCAPNIKSDFREFFVTNIKLLLWGVPVQ